MFSSLQATNKNSAIWERRVRDVQRDHYIGGSILIPLNSKTIVKLEFINKKGIPHHAFGSLLLIFFSSQAWFVGSRHFSTHSSGRILFFWPWDNKQHFSVLVDYNRPKCSKIRHTLLTVTAGVFTNAGSPGGVWRVWNDPSGLSRNGCRSDVAFLSD